MRSLHLTDQPDAWAELSIYRQRYDIEDRLEQVRSLERSIARRRSRKTAELRRLQELERRLAECRHELARVEAEIDGSNEVAALLIREILDRARIEHGEAWTPTPIRGFRMWRIEDNALTGAQMPWDSPSFTARCLQEVPGDDIPHSESRCGPPACGVYAVKELSIFPETVSACLWDDHAIGVIAMTGKVVEHAHGYRAARAAVVAVSARAQDRWLVTARPGDIGLLFANPEQALRDLGRTGFPSPAKTRAFLKHWKDKEEIWTSDRNSV